MPSSTLSIRVVLSVAALVLHACGAESSKPTDMTADADSVSDAADGGSSGPDSGSDTLDSVSDAAYGDSDVSGGWSDTADSGSDAATAADAPDGMTPVDTGTEAVDTGGSGDGWASGDTCGDAIVVESLPFSAEGDLATPPATDDHESCPDAKVPYSDGWADLVYRFTPTESSDYLISLTPDEMALATVSVLTDCADMGTCVGTGYVSSFVSGQVHEFILPLVAGTTYFLVVDGSGESPGWSAPFTLTIDYYSSPAGESCESPLTVGALPFSDTRYSTGYFPNYAHPEDACGDLGYASGDVPDVVYAFTAPETAKYGISATGNGGSALVYAVTDCSELGTTCLEGASSGSQVPATIWVHLDQGTEVFLIVEAEGIEYTFSVGTPCISGCDLESCGQEVCGEVCGCGGDDVCIEGTCSPPTTGDTCSAPFGIDTLPFTDSRDVSDFFHHYSFSSGPCGSLPGGLAAEGADVVYALTPTETGTYTVDLTDLAGGYFLATVVTSCTDFDASCVGMAFDLLDDPSVSVLLEAGKTYYVVVHGLWEAFTYTLTVTGPTGN